MCYAVLVLSGMGSAKIAYTYLHRIWRPGMNLIQVALAKTGIPRVKWGGLGKGAPGRAKN